MKSSRRGVKGKEGTKGKRAHVYLTESAGAEGWRGKEVKEHWVRGIKELRKKP